MIEKKLFMEVPGKRNDFHSAVLTSFSFNFHHFEFQVLRVLRQKWITNVAILVDQSMLDGCIGLATGNLKQLSQSYSVNGIRSIGAFHPKINFLIGDDKILMFFGSGNITPGGHGKNHELFTTLYADSLDSKQRPILLEAWDYIQSLTKDVSGYNKDRITRQISSNSTLLEKSKFEKHIFHALENDIEVALLYNETSSIFSQLVRLIPKDSITRITIICPYYDEDGATLLSLANHFSKAKLDIYIPDEFGLPPIGIQPENRINFYAWEETKRGQEQITGKSTYKRKLHSKIFHFESEEDQYLMLGSANATRAGLGTLEHRGPNDEFCALYKSSGIDFLKEIGISGSKRKIDVSKMTRANIATDEVSQKPKQNHVFIAGVDLNGHTLTVYLKGPVRGRIIVIYSAFGEELYRKELPDSDESEISLRLPMDVTSKDLSYIDVLDKSGVSVSNKQLINNLEKLFHTDPSKANRSINQVINGLETGLINEFEILSYLNDINETKNVSVNTPGQPFGSNNGQGDREVIEMTYDQAVEASKDPLVRQKIFRTHNSVRLWEAISRMLLDNIQRRNDELEDEEEEGSAETSNVRSEVTPAIAAQLRILKVEHLITQVERLVEKYKKSTTRVTNMTDHKVDVIDFAQFLVVSHIVTSLMYFHDGLSFKEKDWHSKLRSAFRHQMKDILTSFCKLIVGQRLQHSNDQADRFSSDRRKDYQTKTINNALLYIHFIDSVSPERFIRDYLELIAFNIFNRLGKTDSNFEQYLDDISRTEDEVKFNASAVARLRNAMEEKYVGLRDNKKYVEIQHSGVCLIKEQDNHNLKYESIYGTRQIPVGKMKF